MKFCSKCGKEIMDEAVICPGCGCAVSDSPVAAKPAVADEVNIGLCVLSFFIPLFGVIYWPLKHKETPVKAKACGIVGLVSWGLNIIFSIIYAVIMGGVMSEYWEYLL